MRKSYAIWHWVLTLIISPFSCCIQQILESNSIDRTGLLGLYPYFILLGFAFSTPTLLVYLFCFYFLARSNIPVLLSRLILILITVLGIVITISVILEQMGLDFILPYSITAFMVGLVVKSGEKASKPSPVT
ncbi:MAG: hypothetical protein QM768_10710 [Agriterribacter sp.]